MSRADIGGRELDRFLICVLDVISVNGDSGVCVGMSGLFLRAIGICVDDMLVSALEGKVDVLCLRDDLNWSFVDVDGRR
jgi:hypothetical protein